MDPQVISIILTSSRPLLLEGIKGLLRGENDIHVIDHVSNLLELKEVLLKLKPHIAIVEYDIARHQAASDLLRKISLETKVLILLKDHGEETELSLLNQGVSGIMSETTGRAELIKCIRAIAGGQVWARRQLLERYLQQQLNVRFVSRDSVNASPLDFTKREQDIMLLVCKGCRNKEIAKRLFINEKTVKYYMSRIFKKLKVRNRRELSNIFSYNSTNSVDRPDQSL